VSVFALGLNHTTAPLDLRGRFAFAPEQLAATLHGFKERLKRESEEGTKAGAGGTPTFFINGYKLVGAQPVDAFKKLIDQELAKKK